MKEKLVYPGERVTELLKTALEQYKNIMGATSLVFDKGADPRKYLEEFCYEDCPFMSDFSSCEGCNEQQAECFLFGCYVLYDDEDGIIKRCFYCMEFDKEARKLREEG